MRWVSGLFVMAGAVLLFFTMEFTFEDAAEIEGTIVRISWQAIFGLFAGIMIAAGMFGLLKEDE